MSLLLTSEQMGIHRHGKGLVRFEDLWRVFGGAELQRELSQALENPESCLPWLSGRTGVMRRLLPPNALPEFEKSALELRNEALRTLRSTVAEEVDKALLSPLTVTQILNFFRAECAEGHTDEARAHARVISFIARRMEKTKSRYLVPLVIVTCLGDVELSCVRFQHTMFDFEKWVPIRLQSTWEQLGSALPTPLPLVADIHPSIQDEQLREILFRVRHCLSIWESPPSLDEPQGKQRAEYIYIWMSSRTLHDMGIIINRATDLINNPPSAPSSSQSNTPGQHYMTATLAMTILCCLRKYLHQATVNGVDLRDVSHVIMPKIHLALDLADKYTTPQERSFYSEALLWVYFTGAHFELEQRALSKLQVKQAKIEGDGKWFSRRLAAKAKELNVIHWEDTRRIVQRFAFSEDMHPHPREWFEDVLRDVDP